MTICSQFYIQIIIYTLFISELFKLIICRNVNREGPDYWRNAATNDLRRSMRYEQIPGPAQNVIVFMADGMGLTTTTAARIYAKGEEGHLIFEQFPEIAVLKTYSADKLVPDSCSTATALFCGVKVNHKTSGVTADVNVDDCDASLKPENQLESIFNWAQAVGKSTGFVTTTRVTHATPSALYAHAPNRNWECEATMPPSTLNQCKDIARQLIEDSPGRNINVIMGGGRQCLLANVTDSMADPIDRWACLSRDGRNLIRQWEIDKKQRHLSSAIVNNNYELNKLDGGSVDYVLGIFANGHLKMDYERDRGPKGMPSLQNMTVKAVEILKKNPKGYILVVEGGLIDFAHHRGNARKALDETRAFNDAIEAIVANIDFDKTLVIVTSDHSHSLVLAGYPSRDISVLDVAQKSKTDGVNYTSLLYATGGPNNYQFSVDSAGQVTRPDPSLEDTRSYNYSQQAAVLTDEVTHSGTDVLVYAQGPMAHLFHSVHEQTYLAYVISYATQIGPFKDFSINGSCVIYLFNLYWCLLLYLIGRQFI